MSYIKEAAESLLVWERDLFFALNGSDSAFLDGVMWTISERLVWIPLYLFILFLFFYKNSTKTGIILTVFFILVLVVGDQISSSVFKPFFARFRPTHHPDFASLVDTVKGYRGGRYGFISGHATNSFALSTFISLVYKNKYVTITTMLWAILNSYTRIYLGVHFVSDIVGGILVGTLIGIVLYHLCKYVCIRFGLATSEGILLTNSLEGSNMLSMVLGSYVMVLVVFSPILSHLPG